MIKRGLLTLLAIVLIFVLVLVSRALLLTSDQLEVAPVEQMEVPPSAIAHLQRAIQFATISHEDSSDFEPQAFLDFHQFLSGTYPLVDNREV